MNYNLVMKFLTCFLCCILGIVYANNLTVNVCMGQNECWSRECNSTSQVPSPSCVIDVCTGENMICENGGLCVLDSCFCSNNFYGSRCQFLASTLGERPGSTGDSITPTGILGLEIGYPLYLSLIIPSAAISAFIVCHLCLFCWVPTMCACRRNARKITSEKMHTTIISNPMQSYQADTPSAGSRVNLHTVHHGNRQESASHEYSDIDADQNEASTGVFYQNMCHNTHSLPNRPLPPPPAWPPEMVNNMCMLPSTSPPAFAKLIDSDSDQYSYPYVTFSSTRSRDSTFPRCNVRGPAGCGRKEEVDRGENEVVDSQKSGYTSMAPKYVFPNGEALV